MMRLSTVVVTCVLVSVLVTTLGNAEIHRAVKNKHPHHRQHRVTDEDLVSSKQYSTETWVYSLIAASLVGLSGIFPLLVIPLEAGKSLRKGESGAFLKLLLSFAVGALLGDVFLHLLPEAWAHVTHEGHTALGLWVMAGLLTFMIVEKLFPDSHDENDKEDEISNKEARTTLNQSSSSSKSSPKSSAAKQRKNKGKGKDTQNGEIPHANGVVKNGVSSHSNGVANGVLGNGSVTAVKEKISEKVQHIKTSGWLNLMANVIDNFTHGLAVASSFCVSDKVGFVTTIAILLHEIPHEIGDFAILLRSGFDRWKAAKAQILTASGGLIGALTALTAESTKAAGDSTAWILPFTSGGFLYIALVTVVPDLLQETCPKESMKQLALLLAGIGTMFLVTLCV